MEKKTMGSFLAALRRANGMTQKELAERLNVSDKSVSRWERDDGAPDLALIPVIAEVFGVTCDELLRGERHAELRPLSLSDFHHRPVLGLYCKQYRHLLKLEKQLKKQVMQKQILLKKNQQKRKKLQKEMQIEVLVNKN